MIGDRQPFDCTIYINRLLHVGLAKAPLTICLGTHASPRSAAAAPTIQAQADSSRRRTNPNLAQLPAPGSPLPQNSPPNRNRRHYHHRAALHVVTIPPSLLRPCSERMSSSAGRSLGGGRILGSGRSLSPAVARPAPSSNAAQHKRNSSLLSPAPSESDLSSQVSGTSPASTPDAQDLVSRVSLGREDQVAPSTAQAAVAAAASSRLVCPICNDEMVCICDPLCWSQR